MKKHDCPHGLDLRKHPRCYLCKPEPKPIVFGLSPPTADFTVRCTCPPDRGDMYAGTCFIHDVQVTYTT